MSTNRFNDVSITGELETISKMLTDSISKTLEESIKEEIHKNIDPIISQVARETAQKTATYVKTWRVYSDPGELRPKIQIQIVFNNEKAHYVEE